MISQPKSRKSLVFLTILLLPVKIRKPVFISVKHLSVLGAPGGYNTCFDQIIFFLQNDVQTQFTELVQETQDYYQSIQEIQVIISEITEESETFVNTVQNIQNQIHAISDVPDSDHISSQDILEKARQTEETTQEMSVIVNHNKENALEINNIVERFSWKNN